MRNAKISPIMERKIRTIPKEKMKGIKAMSPFVIDEMALLGRHLLNVKKEKKITKKLNRKEIEQLNFAEPYCFETDREEDWYNKGCIDGLAAADAEPNLDSLWHDTNEEPRKNQWFLAQIGDNAFDTFIMAMDKNKDWREWSNGVNIKRWAYVNDLLPKRRYE